MPLTNSNYCTCIIGNSATFSLVLAEHSNRTQPPPSPVVKNLWAVFQIILFLVSLYDAYLSLISDSDSKQHSNPTVIEGSWLPWGVSTMQECNY